MRLCSRQNKDNMGWWFFQRLEQGVRGAIAEHMDFINDINLVACLVGSIVGFLPEATDIFNAGVAGGINFNNIQGTTLGNCLAHRAGVTRLTLAIVGKAVDRLGQNTPGTGLASAAGATEKVGVRYTPAAQGIEQRPGDLFLTDYLS
ncbi:hypothetical protein ES703_50125 [subsurface metagenome]